MASSTTMLIPVNSVYRETIQIVNESGAAVDLTGCDVKASFKLNASLEEAPIFTLSKSGDDEDGISLAAATGYIYLTISAARTALLENKKGVMDMLVYWTTGVPTNIFNPPRAWVGSKAVTNP